MIVGKKRVQGVTLFEMLLVLAIAMSILYLGIKQYNVLSLDADATKVQANVDTIFAGLTQYYRVNCFGSNPMGYNGTAPVIGTLNAAKAQTTPFPINITTDLMNAGYMSYKLQNNSLANPTIANTYIAQFNPQPGQIVQTCTHSSSPPTCDVGAQTQIGTVVSWTAQVAVKMKDANTAKAYAKSLGANCSSTLSGGYVNPCSLSTPGVYVVWEKQPSFASSQAYSNSTYWESMPLVKQFTKMYSVDPITTLTTGNHSPEYQYFYCGN